MNRRQAETVRRVTDAARAELHDVGFEAMTVRSVAGRAAVAPATGYTYFSSKNHLVAEIFWRRLTDRARAETTVTDPIDRVAAVLTDLATLLADEPELGKATMAALLVAEPDVRQLRVLIAAAIDERLASALGTASTPELLDALSLIWSGAMVQAGMGHGDYQQLGERMTRASRLVLSALK